MEKFSDSINQEDIDAELARIEKEIEKDLSSDPEALAKIKERDEKKIKENFDIYGVAPEEEIELSEVEDDLEEEAA